MPMKHYNWSSSCWLAVSKDSARISAPLLSGNPQLSPRPWNQSPVNRWSRLRSEVGLGDTHLWVTGGRRLPR